MAIRDTSEHDVHVSTAPPGRGRRRLLAIGGVAAVALVLAFGVAARFAGSRSVDAQRLRIATVTRGMFVRDASVNGRVVAAVSPTLYAPVASTVVFEKHAGDTVKKGDILARLVSPELESELARERSTLQQLESQTGTARIAASRSRLDARKEADEAQIALQSAERDLQRIERGFKGGALAEIDYLRAQDALKTSQIRSRNAIQAARLTGTSAGFSVQTSAEEAQRQRLVVAEAVRRVDELNVRAPIDGVIGTTLVADRAVVPANAALLTVVDLSRLEVELEVPETYAEDLGLGMTAQVQVGATTSNATISSISPEVVNRQVLARVRFANGRQPPGLRQNQRVTARVLIEERPNVLMVERGPFVDSGGGRYAYFVDGSSATKRPLRVGATSISAVEILDGAKPGDRIVVAGSDLFGDAEKVTLSQ
ncbi:efflux RND transporter periplasmic adaptor subunit [Cognatilysobacter lacus]|uniref:Efflux RND transporter periplasmic adaptor subunit n=1 Tax=Cognatilysobacter lacus TaxID=1643323 RepID=A0A5D8Z6F0_9GAMM|nr:efflux RND transporter periplasmic adaptor subunit [Lysobacter lacus]TZF90349.1 efflux RND transporter periplasmic adaptor subunit [Lysobacter lacus]